MMFRCSLGVMRELVHGVIQLVEESLIIIIGVIPFIRGEAERGRIRVRTRRCSNGNGRDRRQTIRLQTETSKEEASKRIIDVVVIEHDLILINDATPCQLWSNLILPTVSVSDHRLHLEGYSTPLFVSLITDDDQLTVGVGVHDDNGATAAILWVSRNPVEERDLLLGPDQNQVPDSL